MQVQNKTGVGSPMSKHPLSVCQIRHKCCIQTFSGKGNSVTISNSVTSSLVSVMSDRRRYSWYMYMVMLQNFISHSGNGETTSLNKILEWTIIGFPKWRLQSFPDISLLEKLFGKLPSEWGTLEEQSPEISYQLWTKIHGGILIVRKGYFVICVVIFIALSWREVWCRPSLKNVMRKIISRWKMC